MECDLLFLSQSEMQKGCVRKVDFGLLLKRLEELVVLEGNSVLEKGGWYFHLPVVVQLEGEIAFGRIIGCELERGRNRIAGTVCRIVELLLL